MLPVFDGLRNITLASVAFRLILSTLCGGIVGMEREFKRRSAGFRTHILICLGAAMTTLTSEFWLVYMRYYLDAARLGAGVVAGMGFIGAGTIIVTRRQRVKGLTTAAGLWTIAIVGLAIGAGFYEGGLLTAGLILLNILVFLIVEFTGSSQNTMHMLDCGAAFTPMIIQGGEYYRLFTCMFLHFGIEHLLNNMLVLFVLGSRLEQVIGKIKFLLIYLIGGVLGNVISLLIELRTQDFAVSAGASGAVFAVMGAMIYIVIRNKGWLGDLSMRQILVMAAFSLYFGFASTGVDNTAHVGGMVSGFFLAVIFYHPGRKI